MSKKRPINLLVGIVAALLLGASFMALSGEGSAQRNHREFTNCKDISTNIALSSEDPTTYELKGELCYKGQLEGKTLQVLVPGFTYDRTYWGFPFHSNNYSYVNQAVKDGYAALNIDRIGSGKSERPSDPDLLTVPSQAYAVNRLVQQLRGGEIANQTFDKIIGVGHSLGGALWIESAAAYDNVDGLILANSLHTINLPFILGIGEKMHPANQDFKFKHLGLADGYVTSKPGARDDLFYNKYNASNLVIWIDEITKAVGTTAERDTISNFRVEPYPAKQLGNIPVLVVTGEFDSLSCDPAVEGLSCATDQIVMEREKPFFSDQVCLSTFVLPNSGHDTNLHYNAKQWFKKAGDWADHNVGKAENSLPPNPC